MSRIQEDDERRTLAVIVDNEPGVLGRVVGLYSARGYNIESLTVAEVDRDRHRSRITIVTAGTAHTLEQIEAQLLRLVPVASVTDITKSKRGVERELALIKVAGEGEKRVGAIEDCVHSGSLGSFRATDFCGVCDWLMWARPSVDRHERRDRATLLQESVLAAVG